MTQLRSRLRSAEIALLTAKHEHGDLANLSDGWRFRDRRCFGLVLRLRRINTTGCCAVTSSLFVFPHCLRCLKGGLYSSYVAQAALISHRLDLALYMASNVFPPYTHDPMAHVTALHPLVVNGGAPPGFEKAYDEG